MQVFFSIREVLNAAHASAMASAQPNPANEQHEPRLFMVEAPDDLLRSDSAILRSIDEIDRGAAINCAVPYRDGCVYTFFQGGYVLAEPLL